MSSSTCSICLASAQARGGVPLCSPGCCGAWYHQTCIDAVVKAGGLNCPMCRQALPPQILVGASPVITAPIPAPVSSVRNFFGFGANRLTSAAPPSPFSFGSRSTTAAPVSVLTEDLLTPVVAMVAGDVPFADPTLTVSTSPEFPELSLASANDFYTRVSVKYEEVEALALQKVPLDIVCVLDNSGSMNGGKLQSLKKAMEFVIQSLGPQDRLSIVNFNSSATSLHGLLKMKPVNQATAKAAIYSLSANGGTNILDGMQVGWSILDSRRTKNPTSCMFLLTDGQDRDNPAEKLALARTMKSSGTSLFVFGFGADHDSEHMDAIANAAEVVFTYIESDNVVSDAFGGTIGAQQGQSLSNITLSLQACEHDVRVTQVLAGRYTHMLQADGRAASVSFVNMFLGETREVLLKLNVPAVAEAVIDYELVRGSVTFHVQGELSSAPLRTASQPATCVVQRVASDRLNHTLERDMEVDVQLNRLHVTAAVDSALRDADSLNLDAARATLTAAKVALSISVSHRAQNNTVLSLMQEVDDALNRVRSRGEYQSGGRAMMQECVSNNSYQRSTYNKAGKIQKFQTSRSSAMQSEAAAPSAPSSHNPVKK